MAETKNVFHLMEVDFPTTDNGKRQFLYACVAGRQTEVKLRRVRNIQDWETEICQASRILVHPKGNISPKREPDTRIEIKVEDTLRYSD